MADELVKIFIGENTFARFAERFTSGKKKQMRLVLQEIKRAWQAEFVRQDISQQKNWVPLKTWVGSKKPRKNSKSGIDPQSYAARKKREYYSGKSTGGQVKFLRTLKRTGVMLDKYIKGIQVNDAGFRVTVRFPNDTKGNFYKKSDAVGTRARVHAGRKRLPVGVLSAREYDLSAFKKIAKKEIERALTKT
jgi:hypothetical protein